MVTTGEHEMPSGPIYNTVTECRVCGSPLRELLDLGTHALTNFSAEEHPLVLRAPLALVQCTNAACELVQLRDAVRPEILYKGELAAGFYWYRSGMNRTMREHLTALMGAICDEAKVEFGDVVVDIGANDGTMLAAAPAGLLRVGYEPGARLAYEAAKQGVYVISELFSKGPYEVAFNRRAKAVSAIAMFYDVADPVRFARDVRTIMRGDGVFVVQMNDLWSMVTKTTFDIIGHEHLMYYSLKALEHVLAQAELEVYRLEHNDLNGGSLRAWIGRAGERPVDGSVSLQREREAHELTPSAFEAFVERVQRAVAEIKRVVEREVAAGGRVYVFGASTRGNTILQAAGLSAAQIEGAAEIHPEKIGLRMVGTGIPIVRENDARFWATMFLVLPYSYRKEFLERERDFLAKGGKMFFPLPEADVVQGTGVRR